MSITIFNICDELGSRRRYSTLKLLVKSFQRFAVIMIGVLGGLPFGTIGAIPMGFYRLLETT